MKWSTSLAVLLCLEHMSLKCKDLLKSYFLKSDDKFHSQSFLFRKTGGKKKRKEKKRTDNRFLPFVLRIWYHLTKNNKWLQ